MDDEAIMDREAEATDAHEEERLRRVAEKLRYPNGDDVNRGLALAHATGSALREVCRGV